MKRVKKCRVCRYELTPEELDNEGQTICDDCFSDMEAQQYADAAEAYPEGGRYF